MALRSHSSTVSAIAPILATTTTTTTDRQKALGNVLTRIERSFGQGSIMRLGEVQKLRVGCIVDLAEQTGVVDRREAWYSYRNETFA